MSWARPWGAGSPPSSPSRGGSCSSPSCCWGWSGPCVYRGGVFLLCFLTAFFGIYSLISIPWAGALAGCAAGLLAGGLSLKLLRPALILSTGIGGGLCAGAGLLPLLGLKNPLWGLLAGIALAISGVAVQFHTTSEEEG
ncbi:hypothetical protein LJB68_00640 [bacterium 210820-DFI.6.52]|nr:hypothetical protein [bacterium 210820-DFI.6.52]